MDRGSRGITLIELLATLAIVGVAASLVLPAVMSAREASRRAQCAHNLKQLGLAVHAYIATHDALPPAGSDTDHLASWATPVDHSMKARLLAFLEQQSLFNAINFSQPINPYTGPGAPCFANVTVTATSLDLFLCPSDTGADVSEAFADAGGVEFEAAPTNYPNNLGVTPTYTENILNGPAYMLEARCDRSLCPPPPLVHGSVPSRLLTHRYFPSISPTTREAFPFFHFLPPPFPLPCPPTNQNTPSLDPFPTLASPSPPPFNYKF